MDPVTLAPLFFSLFGKTAGKLLKKAAEKHVESFFGDQLEALAKLGRKKDVEVVLERAYAVWFERVFLNVKSLGYDDEDLELYKEAAEKLLEDETMARELMRAVVEPDSDSPDVAVLREAWGRLECPELPRDFRWTDAVTAFRRQVEKGKVQQKGPREILNAEATVAIRDALERLAGVAPEPSEAGYAERMRSKYQVLDLSDLQSRTPDHHASPILLRDVFMPQQVRDNPPPEELPRDLLQQLAAEGPGKPVENIDEERLERLRSTYAEQPQMPVLEAVGKPGHRHAVIIGDPGSGKSSLTRYLLLSLLFPPSKLKTWQEPLTDHFPLLIELRDYNGAKVRGHCTTFLEYLDHLGKTDGYRLSQDWVHRQLDQRPLLVMFDGLDEIFDRGDRQRITQNIAGFASDYPRARILVTTRPVGYKREILESAGFRHLGLQGLTEEQIHAFVHGWFAHTFSNDRARAEQRIERVLEACRDSPSVRLLASNPMLLTLMVEIARYQELPRDRARFYELAAELLCHHWEVNRALDKNKPERERLGYLDLDDKKALLRRIARRMQDAPSGLRGNVISGESLKEEIKDFLISVIHRPKDESHRTAAVLIDQLRRRNYILCLRGPNLYGFVHRTFLEYFCAADLTFRLEKSTDYTLEDMKRVYRERWQDEAWNEPLRLICGLIGEELSAELIEELVGQENDQGGTRDASRSDLRKLALAVQCLAELRNPKLAERASKVIITRLLDLYLSNEHIALRRYMFVNEVMPAVRQISGRLPPPRWLEVRLPELNPTSVGWDVREAFGECLGVLLAGSPTSRKTLAEWLELGDQHTQTIAISALLEGWYDNETKQLLVQRAYRDEDPECRILSLSYLAKSWNDDGSRKFLIQRTSQDDDSRVRGAALGRLAVHWPADFGHWLSISASEDLDGTDPFVDPLRRLSDLHIAKAAERLAIAELELRDYLTEISKHYGWRLA